MTSTFYEGQTDIAESGFQGLIDEIPLTLEFEYREADELNGSGDSLAAAQGEIAFHCFDVEFGDAADGQTVRWGGKPTKSHDYLSLAWPGVQM